MPLDLEGPFLSVDEYLQAEHIRQRMNSRISVSTASSEDNQHGTFSLTSTEHEGDNSSRKVPLKKKKREKQSKSGKSALVEYSSHTPVPLLDGPGSSQLEEGATQTYKGWSMVQENTQDAHVKKIKADRRRWNPRTPQGEDADFVLRRYNFAVDENEIVSLQCNRDPQTCHFANSAHTFASLRSWDPLWKMAGHCECAVPPIQR